MCRGRDGKEQSKNAHGAAQSQGGGGTGTKPKGKIQCPLGKLECRMGNWDKESGGQGKWLRLCVWGGGGECLHQGTGLPQGELGEAGPAGGRGRGASQARRPRGNQGEKWPEVGCCRWGAEGSGVARGSSFQGL